MRGGRREGGDVTTTKPFRESRADPHMDARREEARFFGDCLNCFGAGWVWSYSVPVGRRLQTIRGEAFFEDGRGVRHLTPCGCKRAPGQAPMRVGP